MASLLAVGAWTPARAAAIGPSSALRAAAGAIAPVENVGCWAYGWRGWGWYPGIFRCAGPPYPAYADVAPVAAPAPVYAEPRRCWVATDPYGQSGYWRRC